MAENPGAYGQAGGPGTSNLGSVRMVGHPSINNLIVDTGLAKGMVTAIVPNRSWDRWDSCLSGHRMTSDNAACRVERFTVSIWAKIPPFCHTSDLGATTFSCLALQHQRQQKLKYDGHDKFAFVH